MGLDPSLIRALNNKGRRRRVAPASGEARDVLLRDIGLLKLPTPEIEYPFASEQGRRYKFDVAWPAFRVAVEIEGLIYSNAGDNQLSGRHVSVTGFTRDCLKYGLAFSLGWSVVRCTSKMARDGTALKWLEDYFARLPSVALRYGGRG